MEEESLKNFINSVIFLVKLFSGLKDKFLAQKLYDKIYAFIACYVKPLNPRGEDDASHKRLNIVQHVDMSHNIKFFEFKNATDSLLELLDYLEHSKLSSTTPLLYARRNLLDFKLSLIRQQHRSVQMASKQKENKPAVTTPVFKNIRPRNLKESSNKDKIFNFIKHSPNSRTKEIIEEFNLLSERTVKRNLKELISEGLVRKFSKDKGVYYSTT